MKLYYYKSQNFGDALNPWLWPKLFPNIINENDNTILVGIGTIINENIPVDPRKVVLGSGVGFNKKQFKINEKWEIYFVRGPLSAKKLNIDSKYAITDGAYLLTTLQLNKVESKKYRVSFMPHVMSTERWNWKDTCNELGINYIDPKNNIDFILKEIRRSELIISEAMHGAIIADIFRIPWIPVVIYNQFVLDFKWKDWCSSIGVEYKPIKLFSIYKEERISNKLFELFKLQKSNNMFKNSIYDLANDSIKKSIRFINSHIHKNTIKNFIKILKSPTCFLSTDSIFEEKLEELNDKIFNFKKKYDLY